MSVSCLPNNRTRLARRLFEGPTVVAPLTPSTGDTRANKNLDVRYPKPTGNQEERIVTTTEDRVAKLEADSTANAIVQRELTESIEKLTRKVEEGFHSIEKRLGRIDDSVTELPTLREIAATVRHIVEESQS